MQECHKDECHCGSARILLAAKYGHIEIGSHLLLNGTWPQARDCNGATASQVASCNGHFKYAACLCLGLCRDMRNYEVKVVRGPSLTYT